ncbi:hypothetical protein Y032_0111g209 [Ancylostoma ceylanicum]|uniref:Uncharacterized protein n=1 Tax=Ancylostoma ceylanicum TaxID=53326 RepID=A0A016TE33_9BILA|nr:hypothetical protein Y032_0111g209 [Ancylostoma ceylanicum]
MIPFLQFALRRNESRAVLTKYPSITAADLRKFDEMLKVFALCFQSSIVHLLEERINIAYFSSHFNFSM